MIRGKATLPFPSNSVSRTALQFVQGDKFLRNKPSRGCKHNIFKNSGEEKSRRCQPGASLCFGLMGLNWNCLGNDQKHTSKLYHYVLKDTKQTTKEQQASEIITTKRKSRWDTGHIGRTSNCKLESHSSEANDTCSKKRKKREEREVKDKEKSSLKCSEVVWLQNFKWELVPQGEELDN